jgi:hypothetical protein
LAQGPGDGDAERALVGKVPDRELARRLGRTLKAVTRQRERMRMAEGRGRRTEDRGTG